MNTQKYDGGKSPVFRGLIKYFPRAVKAVADVSAAGNKKYGSWGGWALVDDGFNRYTDALGRHFLDEEIEGEIDSETGCLHAAQVAWNALARLELLLRERENKQAVPNNDGFRTSNRPSPGGYIQVEGPILGGPWITSFPCPDCHTHHPAGTPCSPSTSCSLSDATGYSEAHITDLQG